MSESVYGNDKFIITNGVKNEFTFVIKENGSFSPLTITDADKFVGTFIRLSNNAETISVDLTVVNKAAGKVKLILDLSGAATPLHSEKGAPEDGYYLKPTYSLRLKCDTANNGFMIAKVDKVYVD